MSARDLRGQYATGDHWDRQRAREAELLEKARRHAIVRTHAPYVERPDQGGRVVALCREWGVPCPRFVKLPPMPEVAPGIFATTTDAAMLAALETM